MSDNLLSPNCDCIINADEPGPSPHINTCCNGSSLDRSDGANNGVTGVCATGLEVYHLHYLQYHESLIWLRQY
jgi:hypothetical protein